MKMKIATGTYILQSTRAAFNQNEVDPTCQLCTEEPENLEHFILNCSILETVRQCALCDIITTFDEELDQDFTKLDTEQKISVIIDCTNIAGIQHKVLQKLEHHCIRLIY